jgi:fluoride exporter
VPSRSGSSSAWTPPSGWPAAVSAGVQAGGIGAYTTYSTWALDSLVLLRDKRVAACVLNLVGSLVAGVLLAGLGAWVGGMLAA